jgi:hypothetical protein
LARIFGRDPDEFLNKPISAIRRHMHWTARLMEATTPPEQELA